MPRKRLQRFFKGYLQSDMDVIYAALKSPVQIPIITVLPASPASKPPPPIPFTTRYSLSAPFLSEAPASFSALTQFRRRFSLFQSHIETAVSAFLTQRKVDSETEATHEKRQARLWHFRNTYLDETEDLPDWVVKANHMLNAVPSNTDEAYDRAENLFPAPRFIVDPQRFERQAAKLPLKRPMLKWATGKLPLKDVRFEHEYYKRNSVWCLEDIRTFLRMYFKFPKKFKEIHKHLPHKTMGDLVQFYYLQKMPFKLKKKLRKQAIQIRRSKCSIEQIIEMHIEKILRKLESAMPKLASVQRQRDLKLAGSYVSQEDLTTVTRDLSVDRKPAPRTEDVQIREQEIVYYWVPKEKTESELETQQTAYRKRYGKGASDYKEYARYKEYAFGGDRIQDEGSGEQAKHWTYANKKEFMKLFQIHGRNWEAISQAMDSKSPPQVKIFYETYRKKLNLDALEPQFPLKSAD